MKTEKINYKFVPVPLKLMLLLDDKCTKVLTHLIQLHFAFADENDMYFRSIDLLSEETQLSKRVLNAVLVTLNNLYIVDVYSVGQSRGKKTNQFRINFNIIEIYDSIEFDTILSLNKIQTLNYSDKNFKVEYHNLQNLITKSDNSSDNNLQNLITKSVLEEKLKAYSQNLITKSAKINHNIDNTINNTYKNNIGPNIGPNNNIIYISDQVEKNSNKVNCFISDEELEKYNLVGLSEAESNSIAESETGKVKSNNKLDNSNIDNLENKSERNNISTIVESNTANAVTEETVYSNIDNINKEKLEETNIDNNISTVNSDNSTANAVTEEVDNSNNVIPNYNLDNSNEVNTAVLSPSNPLNEESVISTKKIPENGLKQAKTKELEIINKTDNSNLNINNTIAEGDNSTANAVQEFRDKCTNYTIILEGKKIEIDRTIDEFVREYYSEIMNNILTTKEFEKQRKIFNRMIVDNNLNDTKYNEMCDKLDVRYSRYVQLDKQQANKQTDKEEFTQEEIKYIANELLNQCLNFRLTNENNMQDFYDLRNNYNAFIEEHNVPKEGLKLQKKFAELSNINKKLNTPVSSQSFAV